jgi:hypothetical protein
MENSTSNAVYSKQRGLLTNAEKASPLGYYFAIFIIALVAGIYLLVEFGGLTSDTQDILMAVSDALLIVGTVMFLGTSLYGYIKAKNLLIQDAMFAFSMTSLSFFIAGLVWAYYNLFNHVQAPFPSMADVFFLVGSLALIAGIYSATKAISETTGIKVELNVVIIFLAVVATASIVGTYASFTDILRNGMTPVAFISIAYPSLDIISLALVGNLILISLGRSVFESQVVIALGTFILALSHIYFSVTASIGYARYDPLAVTLYAVSYMLFAIGISRYVDLTKFDILMDRISKIAHMQQK